VYSAWSPAALSWYKKLFAPDVIGGSALIAILTDAILKFVGNEMILNTHKVAVAWNRVPDAISAYKCHLWRSAVG
jgi:hypothetical protein